MKTNIKKQIIFRIMISLTLALTLILYFMYATVKDSFTENIQTNSLNHLKYSANEVDKVFTSRIQLAQKYAGDVKFMYRFPDYKERIQELTKLMIGARDPSVFGYWFTYDSGYRGQGMGSSWFINRDGAVVDYYKVVASRDEAYKDVSLDEFRDHPDFDYYHGAKKAGRAHITAPYLDPYLHEAMISISVPVYDDGGTLMGVAGLDMSLTELGRIGRGVKVGSNGYGMLVTDRGDVIYHPDHHPDLPGVNIFRNFDPAFIPVFQRALPSVISVHEAPLNGSETFFLSVRIPSVHWLLFVVIQKWQMQKTLLILIGISAGLLLLFLGACYTGISVWVHFSITRPLAKLVEGTRRVAEGDLGYCVDIHARNELRELAVKYNDMISGMRANREIEEKLRRQGSLNLLGIMASRIGHEIRNPLSSVKLYIHLLTKKERYQKDMRQLEEMIREIGKAEALLSEYLSLTPNKAGNFACKDLNSIIRQIYPLVSANALAGGQQISLQLGNIPWLWIDEMEIRQLLHHLIRNGLEAMEAGRTLIIRTELQGDEAVLAVHDEGKGFPTHILSRLGTPFLTTKPRRPGLGLAICLNILKRHEACYHIDTSNTGTVVQVKFPVKQSMAEEYPL